uniref:Uncharacterized protein n=1 Tax=Cacopsylla melanoneura TaxID=428564 RepID=A0A8D9FEB0_9HEMI
MSRRRNRIASDELYELSFEDMAGASSSAPPPRLQTEGGAPYQTRSGVNQGQISTHQHVSEQQAPPAAALTQAGRPRQRRKWTNDINEALLRSYYKVTSLESDLTGYRPLLHATFTADHRDYNVSEQRLADQIRATSYQQPGETRSKKKWPLNSAIDKRHLIMMTRPTT